MASFAVRLQLLRRTSDDRVFSPVVGPVFQALTFPATHACCSLVAELTVRMPCSALKFAEQVPTSVFRWSHGFKMFRVDTVGVLASGPDMIDMKTFGNWPYPKFVGHSVSRDRDRFLGDRIIPSELTVTSTSLVDLSFPPPATAGIVLVDLAEEEFFLAATSRCHGVSIPLGEGR